MQSTHSVLWFWYLLGALLCLAWKCQRYCYESKGRGLPFWKAFREWFELVTFGSKVSWIVTIAVVWALGSAFIYRVGLDWLFAGVLMGMSAVPAFAFLFGSLAELVAPAFIKYLLSKIPFANLEGS